MMIRKTLLFLSFLLGAVLASICPPEWRQFGQSCYHLLPGRLTWREANNTCSKKGATLALPASPKEQNFTWYMLLQNFPTGWYGIWYGIWIGCNNIEDEGRWHPCPLKIEGSAHGYENWETGEPNSYPANSYCAVATRGYGGKWTNKPCQEEKHAICKLEMTTYTANNPGYCHRIGADGRVGSRCPVSGHVIKELPATGVMSCGKACRAEPGCRSFGLVEQNQGKTMCQLYNTRQGHGDIKYKELGNCLLFNSDM